MTNPLSGAGVPAWMIRPAQPCDTEDDEMWALLLQFLAETVFEWRLWKWIHDPPLKGDQRPPPRKS